MKTFRQMIFGVFSLMLFAGVPVYGANDSATIIDISTINEDGEGYIYEEIMLDNAALGCVTLTTSGSYIFFGTSTKALRVAADVSATITFRNLRLTNSILSLFELCSDEGAAEPTGAAVTLILEGENSLQGATAITIGELAHLTIEGKGFLFCENIAYAGGAAAEAQADVIYNNGALNINDGALVLCSTTSACINGTNGIVNIAGGAVFAASNTSYGINNYDVRISGGAVFASAINSASQPNISGQQTLVVCPTDLPASAADIKPHVAFSVAPELLTITLTDTLTIAESVSLTIPPHVSLNVTERLVNHGEINNFGEIVKAVSGNQPKIGILDKWATCNTTLFTYTGSEFTPSVSVISPLEITQDYTIAYERNKNAGIATVILSGVHNYAGNVYKPFYINPKPIAQTLIHSENPYYVFTGEPVTPEFIVTDGEQTLTRKIDFVIKYDNNNPTTIEPTGALNALATIKGLGNYCDTFQTSFPIISQKISSQWLSKIPDFIYSGDSIKPSFSVANGNFVLTEGQDFSVNYRNNLNAGTASAIAYGIGNFQDSATVTFKILPENEWTVLSVPDQTYTGESIRPHISILSITYLTQIPASDYTVTYFDNIYPGTARFVLYPASPNLQQSNSNNWEYEGSFTILSGTATEPTTTTLKLITTHNGVTLTGLSPGQLCRIYTIDGQLLYQTTATSSNVQLHLPHKGFYIITVGTTTFKAFY